MEAAVDGFKESLNKIDVTDLAANWGKSEAVALHHEVPNEEATVETSGALEDWYGDRHLVVGRHRQLKKWTHGDGGFRKKLATPTVGWPTMTFLHGVWDAVINDWWLRTDDGTRMQHCNKGPRHKTAATSEVGEDFR
jgi:hypothetical protein